MDEVKRDKIRKEAKQILDDFSKSLDKIKFRKSERKLDENSGMRREEDGKKKDADFKDRVFKNALKKNEDYLIAESKSW